MESTCTSCGNALVINRSLGAYQCVNPECQLYGNPLQTCEVCGRYSVAGQTPSCRNKECAAFERQRQSCGQCGRTTMITVSRMQLCLNQQCPSHDSAPESCNFCSENTLSKVQGIPDGRSQLYACRNRDCEMVLKLVRPCPVCNINSFDLHQGKCLNDSCATHGHRVRECPSCGKKRFFGESDSDEMCANPSCQLYIGDQASAGSSAGSGRGALPAPGASAGSGNDSILMPAGSSAAATGIADEDEAAPPDLSEFGNPDMTMQMFDGKMRNALDAYEHGRRSGEASASAGGSDDNGGSGSDDAIGTGRRSSGGMPSSLSEASDSQSTAFRDVGRLQDRSRAEDGTSYRPASIPATESGPAFDTSESATPSPDDSDAEMNSAAFAIADAMQGADAGAVDSDRADSDSIAATAAGMDDTGANPPFGSDDEPGRIERIDLRKKDDSDIGVAILSDPHMTALADAGNITAEDLAALARARQAAALEPGGEEAFDEMSASDMDRLIRELRRTGNTTTIYPTPVNTDGSPLSSFGDDVDVEPDQIDFEVAFRYLQRSYIRPKGERPSPLYLAIGLSGVGKTCFLTMLGQVLQGNKFYTPRSSIRPQLVKIDQRYKKYIRDLVYDFSATRYDNYLAHGLWPPADIPGQTSEFLVTELLRENEKHRLATLEISGEIYQEFLPLVAEIYTDPSTLDRLNPTQRIIWNLMQEADGLVVLLEPSRDIHARNQMYGQFFQALYQWKHAQVRDILVKQYEQFLQLDESDYPLPLRIIAGGVKKSAGLDYDHFASQVQMKVADCRKVLEDNGINALFVNHFQTFEELRILYSHVDPDNTPLQRLVKILESDTNYQDSNNQLQAFTSFVRGFLEKFTADKDFLLRIYKSQTENQEDSADYWQIFKRYICWHYGLNEEELPYYDFTPSVERSPGDTGPRPFEKLKYLSITFTKTDKDFAIYPASNFPKVVSVDWAAPLPRLGNYLTLCNGYLKYYNASVSGYSVRKDMGYNMGRRGTLTPINIADPILDMLTFTGQPPLQALDDSAD